MRNHRRLWRAGATAVALMMSVTACGGGGGSPAPAPGPAPGPSPGPSPSPSPSPSPPASSADVSGAVQVFQDLRSDGDVNDPNTTLAANDTVASAQALTSTNADGSVVLVGYVTEFPTGVTGDRFATTTVPGQSVGDPSDYFRVTLEEGDIIFLDFRDPDLPASAYDATTGIDLDLLLFSEDGEELVAASGSGTQPFELIVAPEDGEFNILVDAFNGESNYVLSISKQLPTPAVASFNLERLLVSNELSVESTPQTALGQELAARYGVGAGRLDPDQPYVGIRLERLEPNQLAEEIDRRAVPPEQRGRALRRRLTDFAATNTAQSRRTAEVLALLDAVKALNAAEGADVFKPIHYAQTFAPFTPPAGQPNFPTSDPNPSPSIQWNFAAIGWEDVDNDPTFDFNALSPALIAILDDGFLTGHPELENAIVDQRDFVTTADLDGDGINDLVDEDGLDADAEEVVDPDIPTDPDSGSNCHTFHGTHSAGVVAAERGNGGLVGVYPTAELMLIRLGRNIPPSCRLIFDYRQALRYIAGLTNQSQALPPRPADVANMSFGSMFFSAAENAEIQNALNAGVILVASAGNGGFTNDGQFPSYPASYPGVVGVAASNFNGARASYSSFYPEVDIIAPGGDGGDFSGDGFTDLILSSGAQLEAAPTGDGTDAFDANLQLLAGTSFSAPHVAAGAGIMRSIAPNLSPADFRAFLENGDLTNDGGATGKDNQFGYGVMSLPKMVATARDFAGGASAPTPPPAPAITPIGVNFGGALSVVTVEVRQLGEGALSLVSINGASTTPSGGGSGSLISVVEQDVQSDGFGRYTFILDRDRLGAAVETGTVQLAFSDGSTISANFRAERDTNANSDSAALTIQAFRDNGGALVLEDTQVINAGLNNANSTNFNFSDLPFGDYVFVYGTDIDNNGDLCDAGELCGRFPSTGSISITDDTNLNLPLSYAAPTDDAQRLE